MSLQSKTISFFGRNCLSIPVSKISEILKSDLFLPSAEVATSSVLHHSSSSCLLFFATRNLSWEGIRNLHQLIALGAGKQQQLLGCVVDEINGESNGWSLSRLSLLTTDNSSFHFFHSAPGAARRAKSVGRWHLPKSMPAMNTPSLSSTPESFQSVSLPADLHSAASIPANIEALRLATQTKSPNTIESIVSLSDGEPFDYYSYLQKSFPDSQKMNLFASQTPFLNGKPYSLFYNDKVLSGGCVGVAIVRAKREEENGLSTASNSRVKPPTTTATSISLDFMSNTDLYSISADPLLITKSRGNIVLEVGHGKDGENKKTSAVLVNQVHQDSKAKAGYAPLPKENQDKKTKASSRKVQESKGKEENMKIYAKLQQEMSGQYAFIPVVGGDLSKGALALDTLMDIEPSTQTSLEFYRSSMSPTTYSSSRPRIDAPNALLTFSAALVMEENNTTKESVTGGIQGEKKEGNIVVSSEQGFLYATKSTLGGFQVSTIPRSFAALQSKNV